MPYVYKENANPNGGRILRDFLLADSTAFSEGDDVKFDGVTGTLILGGAGGATAGIITGFRKANGDPVTDDGASGRFTGDYTTPASNTVTATIDISKESIYSVALDDTLGTTSGSNKAGVNIDQVAASDQLDESSVQAAGTTAQFVSHGVDNDPKAITNAVLVSIQESQFDL